MHEMKTLKEWADLEHIIIADADGFDRKNPNLMSELFTQAQYEEGLFFCSIMPKPVDCKNAEKDNDGRCLGYSGRDDDEPCKICKNCTISFGYGLE